MRLVLAALVRRLHLPAWASLALGTGAAVAILAAVLLSPVAVGTAVGVVVGGSTLVTSVRRRLRLGPASCGLRRG